MPRNDGPSMEPEADTALAFLAEAGLTPAQAAAGIDALAEMTQAAVMDLTRAARIAERAFQEFNTALTTAFKGATWPRL